ncbi:cyclic nucleotide-binding protein [Secundilactobacillus oryzae JCM 18671]|uniref:Cyclic nucleotide-binding protein n=1 Tax=Secundilactobacillus oryzae JCM 18671 TaxID=1291743 RepID=A0A081BKM9_9LACO|nr:DUF1003 domain-containing protein [Secundilactobacillus oryzae]GAK48597.1 cyclic nucleotide-binding protein [Secundilactobacillus oryzae JCM 18671]
MATNPELVKCLVDNREYEVEEVVLLKDLAPDLRNRIKADNPKARPQDFICSHHLLKYRLAGVDAFINTDLKQSGKINRKLTKALQSDDYEVKDVNSQLANSLTVGQRIADDIARFGGSWGFIIVFTLVLLLWMSVNSLGLFGIRFDTYPFILLNLFLSCIAAIQAPIIMMSQNRAADRDRLDAENDYHVTLKSEHELRILHAKLDHLSQNQMPHSLEVSKIEIEILSEIRSELVELRLRQESLEQSFDELKSKD